MVDVELKSDRTCSGDRLDYGTAQREIAPSADDELSNPWRAERRQQTNEKLCSNTQHRHDNSPITCHKCTELSRAPSVTMSCIRESGPFHKSTSPW